MSLFKKRNVQKRGINKRKKPESTAKSIKLRNVLKSRIESHSDDSEEEEEDLQPLKVGFIRNGVRDVHQGSNVGKDQLRSIRKDENDKDLTDNSKKDKDAKFANKKPVSKLFNPDRLTEDELKARKERESLQKALKMPQKRDKAGDKIYNGSLNGKKVDRWKPSSIHIKANNAVDYERDVCKDFLLNGYCGFGDSCKFLHYREEYTPVKEKKSREWEDVAKRHKKF